MPAKREIHDTEGSSSAKRVWFDEDESASSMTAPPDSQDSKNLPRSPPPTSSFPSTQASKTSKTKRSSSLPLPTVKSIVPNRPTAVMDDEEIKMYSPALVTRLQTLSTYENPAANVYALARIPFPSTWGKNDPYTNHSKILCNPTSDEPILLWIVGHISSTWFMRNNEPDRQCSVTIVPLSKDLSHYANRLICGFSSPPLPLLEDSARLVRSTRWQSPRQGESPALFSSVYDAREVFCAKNEMMPYSAMELKKKDLVLMEMRLCRYFIKDDSNRYSQHRAQFELHAVSLLHSADDYDGEGNGENDIGDFRI
ncbi:hypothetical protein EDD15DRAFT_2361184 [Pisolithus albus]|nr:hypothetical protein EDD15DRAFT_2361184 [Pisolithus albus]